jgi:hypothetical protein
LFELVKVEKKDGVVVPRQFGDYVVTVDKAGVPQDVTLIEKL